MAEGDLVGIFEVNANRDTASQSGDNDGQDNKVQQLINTLIGSDKNASTKNFEEQINIIKDQFKKIYKLMTA
jgi:hypothetical protein